MRIAVCTQNEEISSCLRSLFDIYEAQKNITFYCHFFDNDFELLCDLINGEYDVIFLDLFENLVELIKEIREKDKLVRLIPITTDSQKVEEICLKNIWYCLPSPVSKSFLFVILNRLSADLKSDENGHIVIKRRKGIIRLFFSNLEYVEVINKKVCFHLSDGNVEEVSSSLAEYEAMLLHWPDFIKVHRAYIVNLRYIQKLESGSILTYCGHFIPVSRHLFPQLKKDYLCRLMDPEVDTKISDNTLLIEEPGSKEKHSILLVDDEEDQRIYWAQILVENNCRVQTADSGESALYLASQGYFDCVVLDVRLGQDTGFNLCTMLRERTGAPVVFLSSLSDTENQSQGFISGGIDYITKDTSSKLFWLKIETRIKMAQTVKSQLCSGSLRLDLKNRKVFLKESELTLTTVEFDLLCHLIENPDTVYSPARLYGMVWGTQQLDDGQTIQLHLSQLQRKLESVYPQHRFIETVWGKGYCFAQEK